MKIVHLSDYPLSAAPYRLMQVQRLGGLDARLINFRVNFDPWTYPFDVMAGDDPELIRELLAAADVIHFHNWWRQSQLFAVHPWAWEAVRRKPTVIQFHSPRQEQFEEALAEPSLVKLVVAQYQVRIYPECRPVPNAVPIGDAVHAPAGTENSPPIVAFTPGNCDRGGWSDKGCAQTLAVLGRGFRYRFVTDVCWYDAMAARRSCDIAIDEVVTGSYHMCSLEALSQGLATIAGLDERTVDALEMVTGTREHPWIVARPESLHGELRKLVEDEGYRRSKRREARRYMERYWNTEALTRQFVAIYSELLERSSG